MFENIHQGGFSTVFFRTQDYFMGGGGGEGAEGIQHSQKIGHKIQYKEFFFFYF